MKIYKIKTTSNILPLIKIVSLIFVFFFTCLSYSNAQIKIFMETDLEGVSGVYQFSQTREKGTPANIQACEYFMGDLAAVVRGLRDGGATEIVIIDGQYNAEFIASSERSIAYSAIRLKLPDITLAATLAF